MCLKIINSLKEIVSDNNLTKDKASNLEAKILNCYPDADDDERFEHLLHMLASYEPDGGEYLYNKSQLKNECQQVLNKLTHE